MKAERLTEMTAAAITPTMKRRLEELAAAEQRTESQIVRFAIAAYLEKREEWRKLMTGES